MPYIQQDRRTKLDKFIFDLKSAVENQIDLNSAEITPEQLLELSGDLNYCISRLCAGVVGNVSYKKIAVITGVLENVKQELYRRMASSYENQKILSNGDIKEYENYKF